MIIMGHRGAAALEPENTLLSIERAIHIGVNAVEIDVRLSKDKELVVIHDATVDRTTDGIGPVCDFTVDELKQLDAGKGQRIPTLHEVIEFIDNKVNLVIELKEEGTVEGVFELIKRNTVQDTVYVISFWHKFVKTIKEMDSHIKTGVLFVGCPVDVCIATRICADALVMNYSFIDSDFVQTAHQEGLKVFVWNIDNKNLIRPYADMGVDGIGTNDPRVLCEYFM
jgi:glycerophosphoryl diester phosphodiesterase